MLEHRIRGLKAKCDALERELRQRQEGSFLQSNTHLNSHNVFTGIEPIDTPLSPIGMLQLRGSSNRNPMCCPFQPGVPNLGRLSLQLLKVMNLELYINSGMSSCDLYH